MQTNFLNQRTRSLPPPPPHFLLSRCGTAERSLGSISLKLQFPQKYLWNTHWRIFLSGYLAIICVFLKCRYFPAVLRFVPSYLLAKLTWFWTIFSHKYSLIRTVVLDSSKRGALFPFINTIYESTDRES